MVTEFAEVEYSFFVDVEAAPAGFGVAAFGVGGWMVIGFFFFVFGGRLAWVRGCVRWNLRKLGVMLRWWVTLAFLFVFIVDYS